VRRRKIMRTKIFFLSFLSLLLILGCATLPQKERAKIPSQMVEPTQQQPPSEEKLKELVVPQREEAKKVPEKLYSFFVRDADIQEVLLAFSRESELNIVIDPELSGKVTIDLKRVTMKEFLDAVLSPLGWTYSIEGKFVKIIRPQMETRLFTLNYVATRRSGKREIYASTGGGLQTGALLGQQTGAPPGQQTAVSPCSSNTGYSGLISVDEVDLWEEIGKGLEAIIFGSVDEKGKQVTSEGGKMALTRIDGKGKKLVVNKSTGTILATDYPVNLNTVASFLETIEGSSQRQVTIQAKIMEVILSDEFKEGINWKVIEGLPRFVNLSWGLTDKAETTGFPGGSFTSSTGNTISTPGTFKIAPFGGVLAIGAAGSEVLLSDIIKAISEQGDIKILSSPTISTLNNQKAIIRVGNQDVFFITGAVSTQTTVTQFIQPMTIDIGIILDVTPQIAEDGSIIMNIHPSITDKIGEKLSPDGRSTFPLLSVRETDTTVKVRDGQTIFIAGLMQEKTEETFVGVPGLSSIPLLGGLFRHKAETKRKTELVIMITPTIQVGKKAEEHTQK
jgi:MSHA biogenesis protein MshL